MATISIEKSELEYYKSCAEKLRRIDKLLADKKLPIEDKIKEIRKIVRTKRS